MRTNARLISVFFALALLCASCKASTKPAASAADPATTPPVNHSDPILIATSDSLSDWDCGGFMMQHCPVADCSQVLRNGVFSISTDTRSGPFFTFCDPLSTGL